MGKVLREISKPSSSSSAAAASSSGYAAPPPTTSVSVTETVNGTHHFKINGYSLSKGLGIGKYIASDTFNVGGYSWAIYFYPDGKSAEDNAAYVSLFIALASDGTDVRALFELTLLDQSGRERHKVHTHFGRMLESGPYTLKYRGSMWGYKRFFKRTALETSDYLKDDCLSVNCIVGVVKPRTEGPKIYSIAVPPSNIGQHFGQLLESGKGTDVTFEVDGEYLRRDVPFLNISYGELLKATNGFDTENMIGVGGFGSVFRGILEPHELPIAVKVFNLERRGASKSFMAECESLRNIRHRNLVKIITACSSVDFQGNDFKALVYEFMPNGSLEDWLHPHPRAAENERKSLTLLQQLDVVIDVASALDYLHNQSERPIIHCDLKPSNILLDQDMIAHVGDFGLSRILGEDDVQISHDHTSSFGIRGTIEYAAPEYGMGSNVSSQGDVFSFGTLLLEIFTGKKPTDENLEGLSLRQFVKLALPTKVMDTVDQRLLIKGEEEASQSKSDKVHECLISIFTIGLKCSEESPTTRMKINNALKDLQKIKNVLLK